MGMILPDKDTRRHSLSTYYVPGTTLHGLVLLNPFDVAMIVTRCIDEVIQAYRHCMPCPEGEAGELGLESKSFRV